MTDPRSFGAWLRRERERRGITVRAIADRTKIGAGLLEALERGDVSRWPGGIYRRAFVRSYADTVGLDADLVVANFERVFPADPSAPRAPMAAPRMDQADMRLALVTPAAGPTASAVRTACIELGCVLALGLGGFAAAGFLGFWSVTAVAALVFHLARVLGLSHRGVLAGAMRRGSPATEQPIMLEGHSVPERAGVLEARGEVLSFSDEQSRSTSRRARAGRVLADLSAAASSAAMPGGAARS